MIGADGLGHRVMRDLILRAAESQRVNKTVSRYGMRLGARRFVPAETLDEVVPIFRRLNRSGVRAVTGLFDDYGLTGEQVERHEREYSRQIVRLAEEKLDANVGLKLTHLGVHFDHELMFDSVARLLDLASEHGMRLRIDMEESAIVDATLDLYRRLRDSGRHNVGLVLQSYLHRAPDDLERLLPLGLNVRLVKGAYLEAPSIALQHKRDIDAAYIAVMERALPNARANGDRDARPRDDPGGPLDHRPRGDSARSLRDPDALRHCGGRAAPGSRGGPAASDFRAIRADVVQLSHAPLGRTTRQPDLLLEGSLEPMTDPFRLGRSDHNLKESWE
jgi:hypothetical protein